MFISKVSLGIPFQLRNSLHSDCGTFCFPSLFNFCYLLHRESLSILLRKREGRERKRKRVMTLKKYTYFSL
jgi:hypothetical protein